MNDGQQLNQVARKELAKVINQYGLPDFPQHSAYFKETTGMCNK
jgi:hypothetical protein